MSVDFAVGLDVQSWDDGGEEFGRVWRSDVFRDRVDEIEQREFGVGWSLRVRFVSLIEAQALIFLMAFTNATRERTHLQYRRLYRFHDSLHSLALIRIPLLHSHDG